MGHDAVGSTLDSFRFRTKTIHNVHLKASNASLVPLAASRSSRTCEEGLRCELNQLPSIVIQARCLRCATEALPSPSFDHGVHRNTHDSRKMRNPLQGSASWPPRRDISVILPATFAKSKPSGRTRARYCGWRAELGESRVHRGGKAAGSKSSDCFPRRSFGARSTAGNLALLHAAERPLAVSTA